MEEENVSTAKFREYLRIKSIQPDPDYQSCIDWVKKQADEIGLEFHFVHFEPSPGFALWLTWRGSDPSLKSIMLNSHLDVVPVDLTKWRHDPFAAHKDENGKIHARGSQDMKSVGVQHVEAVRRLKEAGFTPRRNIHVTFVPDEEIGSANGMAKFVESQEFVELNVGFELDEAGPSQSDAFLLSYGERAWRQVKITISGNTGHALNFVENAAVEKLQKIIEGFSAIREEEKKKLKPELKGIDLGDVTTLNITMINGGLQPNVIPPEITLVVDIRITPNGWTEERAEQMIQKIIRNSGDGINYEVINNNPLVPHTPIDDSNKWWKCFKQSCDDLNISLMPFVCPGATDARFLRNKGIPAFGFSPINNTPMLLHDHNEYLEEHVFLRGIDIFEKIVRDLAML